MKRVIETKMQVHEVFLAAKTTLASLGKIISQSTSLYIIKGYYCDELKYVDVEIGIIPEEEGAVIKIEVTSNESELEAENILNKFSAELEQNLDLLWGKETLEHEDFSFFEEKSKFEMDIFNRTKNVRIHDLNQFGEKKTDIFALIAFAAGLGGFVILPMLFVPIGYIAAIVSYTRLKENKNLTGNGYRIIGAILTTLNIIWLMYVYEIGFFKK